MYIYIHTHRDRKAGGLRAGAAPAVVPRTDHPIACIYAYMHTCMYMYMHAYINMCIYTFTHAGTARQGAYVLALHQLLRHAQTTQSRRLPRRYTTFFSLFNFI